MLHTRISYEFRWNAVLYHIFLTVFDVLRIVEPPHDEDNLGLKKSVWLL